MSEIVPVNPFSFGDRPVRAALHDGEPVFVHADVCAVLEIGNPSDALRRLDDDEHTLVSIDGPNGRQVEVNVVTESGLYSLVLGSRKPQARPFKRWVTHEVLPAIRRTGRYDTNAPAELSDREKLAALAQGVLDAQRRESDAINRAEVSEAALESAAPAVEHWERFVSPDDVMLLKDWAALFGLSDPKARQILVDKRIIYRKFITRRFSKRAGQMVDEHEWRAYADRATFAWFDLRPQENVDRYHNGQVRQTLYVRRVHALELGRKVGLTQPQIPGTEVAVQGESGAA